VNLVEYEILNSLLYSIAAGSLTRRLYIGSGLPLESEEGMFYFRTRSFLTDLTPLTLRAMKSALSRVLSVSTKPLS